MSACLSAITLYPIKSCRGISVKSAVLVARGLERDRRYMLVDEDAHFITQREEHSLALVDVAVAEAGWLVSAPEHGSFELPLVIEAGEELVTEVWRSTVNALVVPEGSRWFSQFLRS
jgi:uncharacterized protein